MTLPEMTPPTPIVKTTHVEAVIEYLRTVSPSYLLPSDIAPFVDLTADQVAGACSRGYATLDGGWEHVTRSTRRPYSYSYDLSVTRLEGNVETRSEPVLVIIGTLPSGIVLCRDHAGVIYAASAVQDVSF